MKSKALTLNKGIIKTNLKRFWWMPALMTVFMFLILPYSVINQIRYTSGYRYTPITYSQIFSSIMEASGIVYGIIFPLIVGCFLFSYLHKVNCVSLYHSLPVTREGLYLNAFVSGGIIIAIPMIINAVILLIIMPFGGTVAQYGVEDILKICGHYFLFSFMQLAACFLVGMFTGNFFAHGAFTVIFNYLPVIIYYFSVSVLALFLRGFVGESDMVFDMIENIPGIRVFDYGEISGKLIAAYIVLFVLMVALGIFFYKKRPLESAGDVITFKFFKPIFKYGLASCATVGGYLIVVGDRKEWSGILIALLFALIGYAAAEMLLTKSLKFWKGYKGFLIYVLVCALIVGTIAFDPLGYSTYVPEAENVSKAYINFEVHSPRIFKQAIGVSDKKSNYRYRSGGDGAVFEDAEGIEDITELHRIAAETPENGHGYAKRISIGYVLENGTTVYRQFSASSADLDKKIAEITKTEKYMNLKFPVFEKERENVTHINFYKYSEGKEIEIREKDEINKLLDALRADRVALGEVSDYGEHAGHITVSCTDNVQYDFDLTFNMVETFKVLEILK